MELGLSTELDAVTSYSEIVPDTVVFDDFERLGFLNREMNSYKNLDLHLCLRVICVCGVSFC